jgi:hypothetical protein
MSWPALAGGEQRRIRIRIRGPGHAGVGVLHADPRDLVTEGLRRRRAGAPARMAERAPSRRSVAGATANRASVWARQSWTPKLFPPRLPIAFSGWRREASKWAGWSMTQGYASYPICGGVLASHVRDVERPVVSAPSYGIRAGAGHWVSAGNGWAVGYLKHRGGHEAADLISEAGDSGPAQQLREVVCREARLACVDCLFLNDLEDG